MNTQAGAAGRQRSKMWAYYGLLAAGLVFVLLVSSSPPVLGASRVYVNCFGRATYKPTPKVHPRSCLAVGEPEITANTMDLTHLHWSHWGSRHATATGIQRPNHPGQGGKLSHVRVRFYDIVRGCGGRRYYTRITTPGQTVPLQLTAACTGEAQPSAAPAKCSRYVLLSGGAAGAVHIVDWSRVGCSLRRHIAKRAANLPAKGTHRILGFKCRREDINAGGGGAHCSKGHRYVEMEFE